MIFTASTGQIIGKTSLIQSTATYTVTVTDGAGCVTAQASVTIIVFPHPEVSFTINQGNYSCTYPATVDFTATSTDVIAPGVAQSYETVKLTPNASIVGVKLP